MRVYTLRFEGNPRRPIIDWPADDLRTHIKNLEIGNVGVTFTPVADLLEQARIILLAREMGWL